MATTTPSQTEQEHDPAPPPALRPPRRRRTARLPASPRRPRRPAPPAPARIPRISRTAQVVRFLRVARLLLWTLWVIYRERRRVIRARARGDLDVRPDEDALIEVLVAFRKTALQLGVLMIKMGQFLSARADLLPERALKVLGSLQDEVPARALRPRGGLDRARARQARWASCSPPSTARPPPRRPSARCTGPCSPPPGRRWRSRCSARTSRQLVRTDLSTIRFVIWVVSRFVDTTEVLDLQGLYREFRRSIFEEIDYTAEAAHAARFRELFRDRPAVFVPRVCEGYVARRVLVLEWVDGIKINDYAALEAGGRGPPRGRPAHGGGLPLPVLRGGLLPRRPPPGQHLRPAPALPRTSGRRRSPSSTSGWSAP